MILYKDAVDIGGIKPEIVLAIMTAEQVFNNQNIPLIITSILDGKHMPGSYHNIGKAADFRSKHIKNTGTKYIILNMLRLRLPPGFDVLLEGEGTPNEHYHIEYDPK